MSSFVVQARGSEAAALEKARVVPQGFSWPAFAFSWLWLAYHRCWMALLVWLVAEVAFVVLIAVHLPAAASAAILLLARVFLGLEGGHLRLDRKAQVEDLIEARGADEAEIAFLRRRLDGGAAS